MGRVLAAYQSCQIQQLGAEGAWGLTVTECFVSTHNTELFYSELVQKTTDFKQHLNQCYVCPYPQVIRYRRMKLWQVLQK